MRRYVPDFKLLEATLDAIVVERPSPTDEAPQHLCLDIGYDNEPSRHVLLERGHIAHIRSIGEENDEAAREAEVLECIAAGAGNREAAARLFISEKTVGRHLANVYLKLGVNSRTAAAAWWRDRQAPTHT